MRGSFFVVRWVLVVWVLVLVGCGGGGGSGSSDSSPSPQVVTSLKALDDDANDGLLDEEAYLTLLEQILAMNDAQPGALETLADYLENEVAGAPLEVMPPANLAPRPVNWSDTLQKIKDSETYQMLEAFVTSVGSSLLLPEPVSTILDLGKPEVFVSLSSVLVRTHIYDSMASNQIDASQGSQFLGELQTNPYGAQRSLMTATGEDIPAWLAAADGCFRDCGPQGGNGVYSGAFTGKMTETGEGCTWEHTLSGTVEMDVTGNGTLADPYDGSFDVSGNIVTVLKAGAYCDAGGGAPISYFYGTVTGDGGKMSASGYGDIGTAEFSAAILNATVSTNTISGTFYLDFSVDNPINQPITLTKQ